MQSLSWELILISNNKYMPFVISFQHTNSYNLWDPSYVDMADLALCVAGCGGPQWVLHSLERMSLPCFKSEPPYLLAARVFVLSMNFDVPWSYINALRPLWSKGSCLIYTSVRSQAVFMSFFICFNKTTCRSKFNRVSRLFEPSHLLWRQKLKNSQNKNGGHSSHFLWENREGFGHKIVYNSAIILLMIKKINFSSYNI